MTALAVNRPLTKYGDANNVLIPTFAASVLNGVHLYAGAMVSLDATGANLVDATASTGAVVGVLRKEINNTTGATVTGVEYIQGAFPMNSGAGVDAVTAANMFQDVYVIDDQTVGLTDGGVGRPRAGYVCGMSGSQPLIMVGVANPNATAGTPAPPLSSAFKARAVVTTLQAYGGTGTNVLTETANGAISAADGVTLAVGDTVFIQAGTTNLVGALDSGPWTVTALGAVGSKWVLTRPTWWQTGDTAPVGAVVDIGGEGTIWAGTQWKTFCAKGKVIGTDDPAFYVGRVTQSVTLVAGTVTISNVPIKSTSRTNVVLTRTATGGTVTSTVQYCPTSAGANGLTAGYIGTGQAVIQATVAAGTIANTDTSVLAATIINW